jgi:beta-lactamase regulating signal transducer with metallopeptidase domain
MTIFTLLADTATSALASTALDVAIKVAFLLGLAAIVARLLRNSSAALRHSVWSAAIAGALMLPVLAIVLPAWHAPIPGAEAGGALAGRVGAALGSSLSRQDAHVEATDQHVVDGTGSVTARTSAPTEELQLAAAAVAASTVPTTGPVNVTLRDAPAPLGWLSILTLVWIAGTLLALVPLLLGALHLRTIGRRARDVESDALDDFAARLGRSLGVRRVVRVVEGASVATPMTWGIVHPVVLVPAGFGEWPESRQRDVLLHELAHVARFDCLTQYLASAVCALHWYNPLAWVAARKLRVERERACDDRVLLAGARASEYAEHLLTIARTLRTPGAAGAAALAMARPSHLEGRLLAVLDAGRSRDTLTRRRAATVAGGAFAVVAFIATFAPWSARRAEAVEPDAPRTLGSRTIEFPVDTDSVVNRDSAKSVAAKRPAATPERNVTITDTLGGKVVQYGPGSTIVLNTGPNAHDPSGFVLPGCPVGRSPSSSAESYTSDDDHSRVRVKRGDCQILLEREGKVTYNASFTDIVGISSDGWVEVSDKGGTVSHKLRIVAADDGSLSRTWTVDGKNAPYDATAASWLRQTLLELDRYTDFSQGARMAAVYKEKGVNGVLDEMSKSDGGDYAKRTQIEQLLKIARLDHAQTERILTMAMDDMSGDYERSQLLQALLKQRLIDASLQPAYIAAAAKISGDYERGQVLSALAATGTLTPAGQKAIYTVAKSVSGAYDRSQLIGAVAKKYGLSAETAPSFTAAAETMDSDYDLRTLLSQVVDQQPDLDSATVANFLAIAAKRIDSDYDKAEFFIHVAQARPNTEAERERIAKAAESISSESDYGRVLASLRRMKNRTSSR